MRRRKPNTQYLNTRTPEHLNTAFTLIELLVVIAIIAILAAILFPVFAQAREKARGAACLSNTKQIGNAMLMYIQDYDETTPSSFAFTDKTRVDVFMTLQPYIKNVQVFFCPDRIDTNNTCAFSVPAGYPANSNRCVGYGYNWGFIPYAGAGLLGVSYYATDGTEVEPGVTIAQMDTPAQLAAFADTYNLPRYAMSAVGSLLDVNALGGIHNNGGLRHGGNFNVNFADGHAKLVRIKGGDIPGLPLKVGVSKDDAMRIMWCISPNAIVDTTNDIYKSYKYPSFGQLPCSSAIKLPEAVGVTWWSD